MRIMTGKRSGLRAQALGMSQKAFERLMGLVLTAIAVEMLLNGVRTFAARLP